MVIKWLIILILLFPIKVFAGWPTQNEFVSGTWGGGDEQFGLESGDTIAYDLYPDSICVGMDRIIIGDIANGRKKVYGLSGNLDKVLKCVENSDGSWNEECRFPVGIKCIFANPDGTIWSYLPGKKQYVKYSPTGQLLLSSPTRPLGLGKITKTRSGTEWHYEVEYPDGIYIYDGPKDMLREKGIIRITSNLIMQNLGQKVYAFKVVEEIAVAEGEKKKYKIDKVAEWAKPKDDMVFHEDPDDITMGGDFEIIAEYGEAVIGPDGSIYTWMRSETNYKILRWRWVEQ